MATNHRKLAAAHHPDASLSNDVEYETMILNARDSNDYASDASQEEIDTAQSNNSPESGNMIIDKASKSDTKPEDILLKMLNGTSSQTVQVPVDILKALISSV